MRLEVKAECVYYITIGHWVLISSMDNSWDCVYSIIHPSIRPFQTLQLRLPLHPSVWPFINMLMKLHIFLHIFIHPSLHPSSCGSSFLIRLYSVLPLNRSLLYHPPIPDTRRAAALLRPAALHSSYHSHEFTFSFIDPLKTLSVSPDPYLN